MAATVTYESFAADSANVTVKAGVSRRIMVVVHSEFINITQTGCTLGGASPDFTANIAVGDIAVSQNAIFGYIFDIADNVSTGTSLAVTPTFSTTPTSDVQIHVFHFDEVRGGDVTGVTNGASGSTNLDASITTVTDNAVVVSVVGTGGTLERTTTYGTQQTRVVDTSSDSRATYNLDAGVAGAETIAWTGAPTNRVVTVTFAIPTGIAATSLSTEFPGTALENGWTFEQNSAANSTLSVSGGKASVTIPAAQAADSIYNTSSADQTAGIVHDISGDFDIAVRFSTYVGAQNSSVVGFIFEGATSADMVRWTVYGTTVATHKYGYARSGGTGVNFQSGASRMTNWFYGHPAWYRAKRVGDVWTFYMSGDGAVWVQESTVTRAVAVQTVKLAVGQYNDLLGEPVRFDRVVDLDYEGVTDARGTAVTTYEGTTQTTDFSSLPSWLSLSSAVDGSATLAAGAVTLATAPANGSYGRLTYNGAGYADAGMLTRVSIPTVQTSGYAALGLGVLDGGGNIDQYSAGPLYGFELQLGNTGSALPIRVCRTATAWNELDESYTFLDDPTTTGTTKYWYRIERYGARVRMKIWADGGGEPGTWTFDGEDDILGGEGNLVPYFAVSHNDGAAITAALAVDDLEFYSLSDTPQAAATGAAGIILSASGTVTKGEATVGTSQLAIAESGTATKNDPGAPEVTAATAFALAASGTVIKVGGAGPSAVGAGSIAFAASGTVVRDGGDPWQTFTDAVTAITGATVTGLTNGVNYEFRVAAVNSVGQGPWSDAAVPS